MSMMILDMKNAKRRITDDGKILEVVIPVTFKRRGGRKQVILPSGRENEATAASQQNQPLVIAIARAYRWLDLLESGRVSSIAELAKHNNVDPAYISRFLRLTLLAPDIVEAILDGNEPSGLSLAKLIKDIPTVWEEQRASFGFS